MATYFSCLALSFFGLQRAEKEKKNKTERSSDGDANKGSNIPFMAQMQC